MVSINKILIVSSESALTDRFRNYLSNKEYDIYCTALSDDRLESIIERIAPDIVVVDHIISNRQCVEICLRIRRWTPTPILVLTTANTLENEVRAMDFQAEDYLSEPFDIAIAAERIRQILATSRELSS